MCSINDNLDASSIISSCASLNLIGANCRKCVEQPAEIVLRVKDAYCRNCFLLSVNHKFRACLGKSKLVKPKEKVLIACSGSMSCATLLDLIQCGLCDTTPKRIMFDPVIVFIDEGSILNLCAEARSEILLKMKQMVSNYKLSAYFISLETVCDFKKLMLLNFEDFSEINFDQSLIDSICNMFNDLKSLTSKEDLLVKLRQNLLLEVAKVLGCTKILTAETGTDLAIKLISSLAIGKGAHLSLDVGFCDSRCSSIYLLRPLQDLSKKEVSFYVSFKKLNYIFIPSLSTLTTKTTFSIQKLTENFLVGLQSEFPSTLSTVFRTGEKLSASNSTSDSNEMSNCILCQAPLDISFAESSAFQATQFSSIISKQGKSALNIKGEPFESALQIERCSRNQSCTEKDVDSDDICCQAPNNSKLKIEDLTKIACYGCQLTLKEMKNLSSLPINVKSKIQIRLNQMKLKEDIKDFLL